MEDKKSRNIKIGETYQGSSAVPMLRISGRWFERLGFNSGEYVKIQCEDGRIILR